MFLPCAACPCDYIQLELINTLLVCAFRKWKDLQCSGIMSGQKCKKGRNLEVGADSQAMKGAAYWLVNSASFSLLSYRTQYGQSMYGTSHNGLGTSPSITN